jgi:PAS domain S-box-containing protein
MKTVVLDFEYIKSFYIGNFSTKFDTSAFIAGVVFAFIISFLTAYLVIKNKKCATSCLTYAKSSNKYSKQCERVYNSIDEGVLIFPVINNFPSEFTDANNSATIQLGYSKEEFLKLSILDISSGFKKDKFLKLQSSLKEGDKNIYEDIYFAKDGSEFPVEVVQFCFHEKGTLFMMLVVKDLTEKKQAEEQIIKAFSELKNANEYLKSLYNMKSDFLKIVSHELRTPLNAVMGFSDILKDDESLNQDQKESAQIIHEKTVKLSSIIDRIIEISELDSGEIKPEYAEVSRNEILTYVNGLVNNTGINEGVDFETDIDNVEVFNVDFDKIKKIVKILLENSIYFTKKGKITFSMHKETGNYKITELYLLQSKTTKLLFIKLIVIYHYIILLNYYLTYLKWVHT